MRSIRATLERMLQWVRALEWETEGLEFGGRPEMLLDDEDDGQDSGPDVSRREAKGSKGNVS